jgi:hypothetical protein
MGTQSPVITADLPPLKKTKSEDSNKVQNLDLFNDSQLAVLFGQLSTIKNIVKDLSLLNDETLALFFDEATTFHRQKLALCFINYCSDLNIGPELNDEQSRRLKAVCNLVGVQPPSD